MAYSKIPGTGFASDVYNGDGSAIANLADGNKSSIWHGQYAHESQNNSYAGVSFTAAQSPTKIEIDFSRWGNKFAIGYSTTLPTNISSFTVLREFDTIAKGTDDLGVAWGSDRVGRKVNTVILDGTATGRYWAVLCRNNLPGPLSDGPSANSRASLYEVTVFNGSAVVVPPPRLVEVQGTARASSVYNEGGGLGAINDKVLTSFWSSQLTFATAANPTTGDFAGLQLPRLMDVGKVEVCFYSWGPVIQLGFSTEEWPTSKAGFTIVREIDVRTTPNDDAGVPWGRSSNGTVKGTILLPENIAKARSFAFFTNASGVSVMSVHASGMDRMRINEVYVYERFVNGDPSGNNVTQNAELILLKNGQSESRVSQNTEMLLIKDSEEMDLQVSHMSVTLVVDEKEPETAVTQNAEMLLLTSPRADTNVTRNAEMLFMKSPPTQLNTTRNAEMFLVAETPSVFFMDFGLLEYPVRNSLYQSPTRVARTVPDGAYIQLEGLLAPDSTLYVNGVNMGRSSPIKSGDEVYLIAGVPNFWLDRINIFSYTVVNGQIARDVVGLWSVLQVQLTPLVARSYADLAKYTWIHSINHSRLVDRGISMLADRAKTTLAKLSAIVDRSGVKLFASAGRLKQSTYAAFFRQRDFIIPRSYSEQYTDDKFTDSHTYAALYTDDEFTDSHTYAQLYFEDTFIETHTYAQLYRKNDFIDAKTHPALGVGLQYEDTTTHSKLSNGLLFEEQKLNLGYFKNYTELAHSRVIMNVANYERSFVAEYFAGQSYELFNSNKPGVFGGKYEPIKFTRRFAFFEMEAMDTVAYSSFYTGEYEPTVPGGYGFWIAPVPYAEVVRQKVNLHPFIGFEYSKAHPHLSYPVVSEVIHSPSRGEFSNQGVIKQIAAVSKFNVIPIKRVERTVPVQLKIVKRVEHTELVAFKPYRHEQNVNGIGPASLYMGFDLRTDVESFTGEFENVIIETKFNGYVYKLEVDQTFVCAIYFNGPVKWLLQGG